MEWLSSILNGPNLIPVVISLVVLILVLSLLAKRGVFSLNLKGLSIGRVRDNERNIIQRQMEYADSELETYFADLIQKYQENKWFKKETCLLSKEKVIDVLYKAIALNHITKDPFYLEIKMTTIFSELSKLNLSPAFTTPEFREICKQEIKKILEQLVDIRNYMQKD